MSRADAWAAYLDDEGDPQFVTSGVLFVDLMGVSEMSEGEAASERLKPLRTALGRAIERAGTEHPDYTHASTWFTDNAVIGAPITDPHLSEMLIGSLEIAAAYLLLVLWGDGFLGRGALTYGPHYMDEQFVFGPALIEANRLEKSAKWPRVVLSPATVSEETAHSKSYANALTSTQSQCLIRDEEGVVFVDCLGIYIDEEDDPRTLEHYLCKHRDATVAGLAAHAEGSAVWEKWRWVADYQNYALRSRLPEPEAYLVPVDDVRYRFGGFLDPSWDTLPGSAWYDMDRQTRFSVDDVLFPGMTTEPGVYAVYRGDDRLYVGCTSNLSQRVEKTHLSQSSNLGASAFRRNAAAALGIAPVDETRGGHRRLNPNEIASLNGWVAECRFAWIAMETRGEAESFERRLLSEGRPPLNRRDW